MMKKILTAIFVIIFSTNAYSKHKVEEQNFRGITYSALGSKNYKKFNSDLIDRGDKQIGSLLALAQIPVVLEIPLVGRFQTFPEADLRCPP